MASVILIGLLTVPFILLMFLRINASIVFLSVCLGYVLMSFVGSDARDFMAGAFPNLSASGDTIKLGLLVLPVVLTMIFMIKTVRGSRLLLNILPAIGVGCLLSVLAIPLLPPDTVATVSGLSLWHELTSLQDIVVGASALVCLFSLWLQRPKSKSEEHGKHHKG